MAQHDAARSASDDQIFRQIATKEQELQQKLAHAQRDAARLVEDAQRESNAIRTRAQEQAQQDAAAVAKAAEAEAQAATEQILARARAEADAIQKKAEARMSRAVELVVREVLGGLA